MYIPEKNFLSISIFPVIPSKKEANKVYKLDIESSPLGDSNNVFIICLIEILPSKIETICFPKELNDSKMFFEFSSEGNISAICSMREIWIGLIWMGEGKEGIDDDDDEDDDEVEEEGEEEEDNDDNNKGDDDDKRKDRGAITDDDKVDGDEKTESVCEDNKDGSLK
jgi:hypothetical protein